MNERAHHLVAPASRFVGRRVELGRLSALLSAGQRLVTIWGPAGMGKTRLALQFVSAVQRKARGRRHQYLVDLSQCRDLIGTCAAVARALDVPIGTSQVAEAELAERVGHLLAGRGESLFLFDNFEQVAELAPATVGRWLALAPKAQFLVTSRERLRITGELTEELAPLQLPEDSDATEHTPSVVWAARSEAVELFLERASALGGGLELSEANARKIAVLVKHLEGIPLAIELAAGRLDTLGVDGLLDALGGAEGLRTTDRVGADDAPSSRRLNVLAGGRRDLAARQMTLRAAIAWSWDLLSPVEREVAMQCSVFRSGFQPTAALDVVRVHAETASEAVDTLDVLQSLRNKSLLRSYEAAPGEVRLALYESIRDFAEEQLARVGTREAVQSRHHAHYLAEVRRVAAHSPEARRFFSLELPNVQAIVERNIGATPPTRETCEATLQALLALDAVYVGRGPIEKYLRWLDGILEVAGRVPDVDEVLLAKAYQARGRVQPRRGRAQAGFADLSRALELSRAAGERQLEGAVLADMGVLRHGERAIDDARRLYEEALVIHREVSDRTSEGRTLGNLGALHHDVKAFDEGLRYYREALVILREENDRRLEGVFLTNLGILEHERGLRGSAHATLERALSILSRIGDRRMEAITLGNLGVLHHEEGRLEAARQNHRRALARIREAGDRRSEGLCLTRLGAVLASEGQVDEAREHLDEADDILGPVGDPVALEVAATSRAFLDLARAGIARAAGHSQEADMHIAQANQRMARAVRGSDGERPAVELSDDARMCVRILERALARIEGGAAEVAAPPPDALLVGPDGSWMRPPQGAWQDLRRRKNLRLLLLRLVVEREREPGKGLALDALREAGWPGENIAVEAAINRLHVALAELRKRGLRPLLLKVDGGYLLDPGTQVRRVSAALCPS